jgi:2-keto-4-pentenoate hydratase/2-oxohepta-3-ene-1,7-dioic acid hydratase in catechol pathway
VTVGTQSYDLTEALHLDTQSWPPVQMVQFIANIDHNMPGILTHALTKKIDVTTVHLDVPISWPNKLLAFPVNYLAHGVEMKSVNRADLNGFFLKANSSLSGPNDAIVLPDLPGREIHHECELGIVIGKGGKGISEADAMKHVWGYTAINDVTARDWQQRHKQWFLGKSFDTFCPMGPWVVTADQVVANDISVKCWVNGELRQNSNTKDFIFNIPNMIATVSAGITLYPGDLIATGTPAGVGIGFKPPKYLVNGDVVVVEMGGIGKLENTFIAE